MKLNEKRIEQRLSKLSEFTIPGSPWTRRAFTEPYARARDWLEHEMTIAGLTTRIDHGGNLIGTLPGTNHALGSLASGSHIDTVVDGGRYDGILGVVAALETAQSMKENNYQPHHNIEVIDFLSEEPSDYGISCIGSRAMSGNLSSDHLQYTNASGEKLHEAIRRAGGTPEKIQNACRSKNELAGFVELHIEQGRVLESNTKKIGVVTNIVGIKRFEMIITGRSDHSGTTPMNLRQDALVGASKIIERVNTQAKEYQTTNGYLVATIGAIHVRPNAVNAVPGEVRLTLEVRSDKQDWLDHFPEQLITFATKACETERLQIKSRQLSYMQLTDCADLVIQTITRSANTLGLSSMTMPSGAGHDSVFMAQLCPTGMLFIPCLDGRSHCPEESITMEDAINGANVLAQSILSLDQRVEK